MAYDQLEPLPDTWLQTGIVASVVANAMGRPKNRKPFEPADFIPSRKGSTRSNRNQTPEQGIAMMRAIMARSNKSKRKKP